jgi:L-alanine-DL-glutamate epimerase-like enolase superfamily enzyme
MKQEVMNTLKSTTYIEDRVIIQVETPEGVVGTKEIVCANGAQAVAVAKLLKGLWGGR